MSWEVVIGLEIHAQLATRSKIFSGASTAYGGRPNTQACAVDLALPGVLPVLNAEAVRMAVTFGLAIGAEIGRRSVFARKNYFYPDLPKGYQISQYELPVVGRGSLQVWLDDGSARTIGITRAHLEEDAGKSVHDALPGRSGIDLNRAGTPLLEIVSEPEMRSAREAVAYMKAVHALVRHLRICDGNMQEGSLRCDANVSLRRPGTSAFGTRVEIKNLNSFRYIERAINHEVERQADVLEAGGRIVQETRLYDADRNETRPLRQKEEANDYRYFPDPDLLPLVLDDAFIESVRAGLPELPWETRARFESQYGLGTYDAAVLTAERDVAAYFEAVVAGCGQPKPAANWVMGEVLAGVNRDGSSIAQCPVPAGEVATLIARISDGTLSGKLAKEVFEALWAGEGTTDAIISARGLRQLTDASDIAPFIAEAIRENPEQVQQYRSGRTKLLAFFVGQVMKKCGGRANPQQLNELLAQRLAEDRED